MPKPFSDLTGRRFGRLVATVRIPRAKGKTHWACRCDCGKVVSVRVDALNNGQIKSCGCFRREHGAAVLSAQATHRMSDTPIYRNWVAMIARCHDPDHTNYKNYGGRGIRVCPEWHDFARFYEDVGRFKPRGLSLDRIDNDRGYEPGNVRWATQQQQTWNTRRNVFVRVGAEVLVLSEAARRAGLDPSWYRKKLLQGKVAGAEIVRGPR